MTKVIYFSRAPGVPLKVVRDCKEGACSKCYFKENSVAGCPEYGEERRAGVGSCIHESHHYEEVK
jgi:hypothetical protein